MNVVVIVADSLRVDHVGCYGSHVKTPNVDRLAIEGTVFEQGFARVRAHLKGHVGCSLVIGLNSTLFWRARAQALPRNK